MANVTITELPAAGPITGTESVPIVQNGQTLRTTTGAIAAAPSQVYQYLTVVQTPQLPNSRYVGATNGLTLTDGGAQGLFNITTTGALLSLVNSGTGFQVKTSGTAITGRAIAIDATSTSALSITNGDGVAGNPTISLIGQLLNLANLSANGLMVIKTSGAVSSTSILNVADQTAVYNADGTSGNPTIGLASNPIVPGTGAIQIPAGTTGQRPAGVAAKIRYNTSDSAYEGYSAGAWRQFSLSGGVTEVDTGTGLTGGPITGVGTISIANTSVTAGSYGSATQVGTFTVNAQGQLTAAANVTITPAGIGAVASVSGTANEITATGASIVVLSLPTALTFTGKTVTNGTFNMTAATVGSDTVTTNTAVQTLTNKSISGSTNTLTNITNGSLTNSSITIGSTSVSLGGTAATVAGLTLTTPTIAQILNGGTLTLPTITDTLVARTTTDTLTNKTISGTGNTLTNIGNSSLTNSTISGVALGSNLFALTIGTGLTGTSYNGSAAVTVAIDSTVVTLTGTQTLTNKTISGSSNTLSNIGNSSLTNSSVTIGTTAISLGGTSLTLGGLTSVAVTQDPTTALQLATKQYVDTVAAVGLTAHPAVQVATTQSLAAQTGGLVVYNNGASGVGATLTLTVALTTLDGYSLSNGDRILVKNEVNQAYNGVYTWATGGTVLTRSTDTNSYGPGSTQLSEGDYFFVQNGTVNKGNSYVCATTGVITFGTTAITFNQFSTSQIYTGTSPIVITGTVISLTTVPVNLGGTNLTSYAVGDTLYASGATTLSKLALGTQGYVLTAGASGPVWSGISGGTF